MIILSTSVYRIHGKSEGFSLPDSEYFTFHGKVEYLHLT
jgi:hypothetical protein